MARLRQDLEHLEARDRERWERADQQREDAILNPEDGHEPPGSERQSPLPSPPVPIPPDPPPPKQERDLTINPPIWADSSSIPFRLYRPPGRKNDPAQRFIGRQPDAGHQECLGAEGRGCRAGRDRPIVGINGTSTPAAAEGRWRKSTRT